MTYIVLISMIFVSLAFGIYIFTNDNLKEGLNEKNKQNIGDLLLDQKGKTVQYKDGSSADNIIVTSVDGDGTVNGVKPNIRLDSNGFPLYDYNSNTYLNNNKQNKGDSLIDGYGKIVYNKNTTDSTNNTFKVTSVNVVDGTVTEVTPNIKLTSLGYAELNRSGNVQFLDNSGNATNNTKQLPDVDTEFHPSESQIIKDNGYGDLKSGDIYVEDQCGNRVLLPKSNVQGSITYYQPGVYRFGASTYVPNYEDSVYLSKTTGQSTTGIVNNSSKSKVEICTQYKDHPQLLEEACQKMDGNLCASTSCCVLLGGSKCVSGNEQGATIKSNYSDVYIPNRDFHYYQGKCYGNCRH
jgi:hypothetical protein